MKGHIKPGKEATRELSTATFDVEKARRSLWSTLPGSYFATLKAISKLQEPQNYQILSSTTKEEIRLDTNKTLIGIVNTLIENKDMSV